MKVKVLLIARVCIRVVVMIMESSSDRVRVVIVLVVTYGRVSGLVWQGNLKASNENKPTN